MTALKGLSPNNDLFDTAWKSAEKSIESDPNLCIVPDLESGYPIIMTLKERDRLLEIWESCKPRDLPQSMKGKILVFGTGGDAEGQNNFNENFYK